MFNSSIFAPILTFPSQEIFELLVARNGTAGDLLSELKKKANLDDEALADVRIYCVLSNKIQKELSADVSVTSILDHHHLVAQKLPKEDAEPSEGSRPIYAFHFDKEPSRTHGVPFIFHLKEVSIKYRILGIDLNIFRTNPYKMRKRGCLGEQA